MRKLALLALFMSVSFLGVRAQKAYVVSNAHFDTQWNWDVQKSISEYVPKTMETNLYLLSRYPDYIFNFEGGVKYSWMKEYYPLEYEAVKQYIKLGRWHVTGSSWDANDANIGSPESLTRNILYGQQFYQQEFGVQGTDIFLPDCFGFPYILPSIAAHSGLIGFSTQKLQWREKPFYDNGRKVPFDFGLWQGVDGSRIMLVADAHGYTTKWADADLSYNSSLKKIVESNPLKMTYHYYGTGDTGGSPTLESVRAVQKGVHGNGPVQIISATSDQMYKDFLPFESHPELPVFNGELLMDVHGTGTYTSQAAMKLFNRRNELLSTAAERAAVMADFQGLASYPKALFTENHRRYILHQFHDDVTGTSIPRAYEFSWNDELIALNSFSNALKTAAGATSNLLDTQVRGIPVVLYNPSSFTAEDVVELCLPVSRKVNGVTVYNGEGEAVPSQLLEVNDSVLKVLVSAKVPAVGYEVYDVRLSASKVRGEIGVSSRSIENSVYKVTLDEHGDISSIYDKRYNKELVEQGKAIRLALFTKNPSYNWPAWEIRKTTLDAEPVPVTENVKITVAEQGALRSAIQVERKYGESTFCQLIRLNEGAQSDRIDIVNSIDWGTTNALLKVEFPLQVSNPKASYDIGLGHIQRGNNTDIAYEVYSHYWTDLTDKSGEYGVAVLNNGKYGWDKPADNLIRLSLLHTPSTRSGYRYQSRQDFGHHEFTYSIVGHKGSLQEVNVPQKAELVNQTVQAFRAPKHKGVLGRSFSMVQTDNPYVVLKAFKQAEEDEDAYILRYYETAGQEQHVKLSFAGPVKLAEEVNGVEQFKHAASFQGNQLDFDIQPFGIRSFKVKLEKKASHQMEQAQLELPYNLLSASYNGLRRTVNFDGKGYAFAAELLPSSLDYKGVHFTFPVPDSLNVVKCRGQEVELPQGNYNKVHLLVASIGDDQYASFFVDGKEQKVVVPSYTGFFGQWGHTGHTEGYVKPADVAFVGTHRHEMAKNKDLPYEFTYMYSVTLDLPEKARTLMLPENSQIIVFAATVAHDQLNVLEPVTELTGVHLPYSKVNASVLNRRNLTAQKPVIERSGEYHQGERAELAVDDDITTKWCDVGESREKFIAVDLGKEYEVKGWHVVHAGMESLDYITKEYALQVKAEGDAEWRTVDTVYDNNSFETDRLLAAPVKARYVRLFITKADQDEGTTVRLYEFQVY